MAKPTEREQPAKTLIPSGLDAVIWFDCSRKECLRRALGRRIDKKKNVIYHIQDNPPSVEEQQLCEVIEPIDDESESMACLIDRWVAFDQTRNGLKKWLTQFGDEPTTTNLMHTIEASDDINSVFGRIEDILKQVSERKQQKETLLRSTIQGQIIRQQEIEEQEKLRALQEEEETKQKTEEASQEATPDDQKSAGAKTARSNQKSKESMRDASQVSADEPLPERNNVDEDFRGVLMNLWKKISTTYKLQMTQSLKKQRVQRENIQEYLHNVQSQFLTFLKRLDNKQEVLDKFIQEFNDFSDQYPDMREDDQTKEELHQRVDILSDELWEIAEERREQAVEERKKIMESGWVEFSLEYLTSCAQNMMQGEIDKFKGTVQLIHDYYHAIEERLVPETAADSATVDLLKEDAELPEVERLTEGADMKDLAAYSYPRLDELFKRALKAQVVPDVSSQAAAADAGKGKAPAKGKDAKKGGAAETSEIKPESLYVKEMKEAIKVEKGILRFRLTQIRNWALQRLQHQRDHSLKMYQKLEDWISVSSKAENDAIDEVCDVIKFAIEDQTKIQNELRIKFMDFFVDKGIMNFIEPPPDKLQAMEEARDTKFSVPQLQSLAQELKSLADSNDLIQNRKVVELFVRKASNSRSLADAGGLPKSWQSYKRDDFERLVRNLDIYNRGCIDYKVLGTCCILLESPLPTDAQVDSMKRGLQQLEVTEECFLNTDLWFDNTEKQKDREYSLSYPRVQHIKKVVFDLYERNSLANVPKMAAGFKCSEIVLLKKEAKTYSDIIYHAINK